MEQAGNVHQTRGQAQIFVDWRYLNKIVGTPKRQPSSSTRSSLKGSGRLGSEFCKGMFLDCSLKVPLFFSEYSLDVFPKMFPECSPNVLIEGKKRVDYDGRSLKAFDHNRYITQHDR